MITIQHPPHMQLGSKDLRRLQQPSWPGMCTGPQRWENCFQSCL